MTIRMDDVLPSRRAGAVDRAGARGLPPPVDGHASCPRGRLPGTHDFFAARFLAPGVGMSFGYA